jgi:hypothetical protein
LEDPNPVTRKVNHTWMIAGVLTILCCCLTIVVLTFGVIFFSTLDSISVNGEVYSGLADDQLKNDTLNGIKQYEASQSGCKDVSLFLGSMITSPASSVDGSWLEEWQVNVCGESHLYSVAFTPSPGGGTDFSITRIDQ